MSKVLTASEQLEEICAKAVRKWGPDAQIRMMVEECGELLQSLMHYYRGRKTEEEVQGEIADVLLMAWQMRRIFGRDGVDQKLQEKLDRIVARGFSKKDA